MSSIGASVVLLLQRDGDSIYRSVNFTIYRIVLLLKMIGSSAYYALAVVVQ